MPMDAPFSFCPLAATVTVLLLFYACRWSFSWNKSRSNTRKHPASPPWCLPIIGHLHLLEKGKPLHRTLAFLCSKYDSPVLLLRLGYRPVLVVSSPAVADECLSTHDLAFANRPRTAASKYLGYNHTALGSANYGPYWRNLRRLTAIEVFSNHRLGHFSSIRSEEVRSFIASLARSDGETSAATGAGTSRPPLEFRKVSLRRLLFVLVFNNIMRMVVGKRYSGDAAQDSNGIGKFHKVIEESFVLQGGATNITDYVPVLRWLGFTEAEKSLQALREKRDGFLQPLINERRRGMMKKQDGVRCNGSSIDLDRCCGPERRRETTVDVMLSLQQEDPEYYTDDVVKGVIMTMLSAGSDTTTLTLEWVMSLLLNHPDALSVLVTEIDSVVGSERLVDDSDLPCLPYLHAVIKETLRLYPVGPLLVPHEAREDCTVAGFHVSRGTMLLINAWAIHRSPEVWDDPLEFKPERFLRGGSDAKTLAFGSGRRKCPGEGMAMRMVGLTVAALIQCFDWKRVGTEKVDMQEGRGITMPKAISLEAMCRPREAMVKVQMRLFDGM